jgi:hypothetical protein
LAGWAISITLVVILFSKLDIRTLVEGFKNANWNYLIIAIFINFMVIAIKALRWQWLMRPICKSSFIQVLGATLIAMAGNNLLPARGGEWLRIYTLGKDSSASRTSLTSILGLDKLFDGVSILFLFSLIATRSSFPDWVKTGTTIFTLLLFVLFCLILALLLHLKLRSDETPENKFRAMIYKLAIGVQALGSLRIAVGSFIISVLSSLIQIITLYMCQLAFGMDASVSTTTLAFIAINLAIVVPSAPSGVGPFEAAAVLAYMWLNYNAELALNVAFGYHIIQFIPATLAGIIFWHLRKPAKEISQLS